jgi:hypothetical protein
MIYFDGINTITTSNLLNFSILRSDTKNLNVPIPSEYTYPELDADASYLLNATNFKILSH